MWVRVFLAAGSFAAETMRYRASQSKLIIFIRFVIQLNAIFQSSVRIFKQGAQAQSCLLTASVDHL